MFVLLNQHCGPQGWENSSQDRLTIKKLQFGIPLKKQAKENLYDHKINYEDRLLAMGAPVWFPSNQIFVEIINIIYYNLNQIS